MTTQPTDSTQTNPPGDRTGPPQPPPRQAGTTATAASPVTESSRTDAQPDPSAPQPTDWQMRDFERAEGADRDRLVEAARAYAADLENAKHADSGDPTPPLRAEDVSAPRAYYGISSTYIQYPKDVMASNVGRLVTSYTVDSASVAADANGNKLVYEGTTMQMSGATQKLAPRTTGTCVGVLAQRINLRDADVDVGLIVGGIVNAQKVWDNGVYAPGLAALQALTLDPLCKNLAFAPFDL